MRHNKTKYFFLILRFIPWLILGVLTLGLALIYVIPYMNIAMANFYKDIRGPLEAEPITIEDEEPNLDSEIALDNPATDRKYFPDNES